MNYVWSDVEKQFIKDNAANMTDEQLIVHLSKFTSRKISLHALRKQRRKLGIIKKCGRGVCAIHINKPINQPINKGDAAKEMSIGVPPEQA